MNHVGATHLGYMNVLAVHLGLWAVQWTAMCGHFTSFVDQQTYTHHGQ